MDFRNSRSTAAQCRNLNLAALLNCFGQTEKCLRVPGILCQRHRHWVGSVLVGQRSRIKATYLVAKPDI
jgi:hypothetical protein